MTTPPHAKLYPPLIRAVADGLDQVLENGRPLDHIVRSLGRNKQFGSRDRKFVTAQLYDITRHLALLRSVQDALSIKSMPWQHQLLIINLARSNTEILDPSGAFAEAFNHIEAWQRLLREHAADPRLEASLPGWLWDLGQRDYGADWPDIACSLNSPPNTYLRTNTLKTTPEKLLLELKQLGVESETAESDGALRLLGSYRLTGTRAYRKGLFEFQDLASQAAAIMCDVQPGMTVLDACAGAGGKTLHLAALMQNKGRILVADADERRLEQLSFRCRRAGVRIAEYLPGEAAGTFEGGVDRVLLDVPCTATGTIARKPEIKWHLSPEKLDDFIGIQRKIIAQNAPMVKKGGKLIYATCSLLKCESEEQADWLAVAHPEMKLDACRRFLPAMNGSDAFFVAVFTRE